MKQTSPEDQKNLILAAVLSFAVIIVWQMLVIGPDIEAQRAADETTRSNAPVAAIESEPGAAGAFSATPMDRETALAQSERIEIQTPKLSGSIALTGGRIDELRLTNYDETLKPGSPPVELLWPLGAENAYYAVFGWAPQGGVQTPRERTQWAVAPGSASMLKPGQPVTLQWSNGAGLTFQRKIAVDEDYLFTVTQSVENKSGAEVRLTPIGRIERHGTPQTTGFWVLHEGPIGVFDGGLQMLDYDELIDAQAIGRDGAGTPVRGVLTTVEDRGWLGFTDKYWMAALVPDGVTHFDATFETVKNARGQQIYRAQTYLPLQTVPNGETVQVVNRLFAGAKEISVIRDYEYFFDDAAEPSGFAGKLSDFFFKSSSSRFIDAIDWGWFFFLTKPIFELLLWINSMVGNMGVAIILLTLLVKTLLFPLAYKSYVSMSKLKLLQPEMQKIKERVGDDRQRMQQEMMQLYKRERVNPAAGCLPILMQIPIFFSLYKVLFVTIEMRHAPFFGWIQDLSAPDPTSIFNLFGLLPYEPWAFLLIGVWPVLMGITMWLQQMLNPAPTDPMQEKIFNLLPLLFTFLLGGFASGLVIYWTANNILTFSQQYTIMRSQGVKPNILGNIRKQLGLQPRAASG